MPTQQNPLQGHSPHDLKKRYRRILRFAAIALAQTWWFELVLPKFGLSAYVAGNRIDRGQKIARRFRTLAADLGGLIIKVGQFASSRLDVLPESITKELESLQDEVAPESFELIRAQIESELGISLDGAFLTINTSPVAAASLGQVHKATLTDALSDDYNVQAVVVKVLRPGIEKVVEVDLLALRRIGRWLSRIKLVNRRADAPALVEEFAQVSLEEIDYFNEAANLERFRSNFADDPRVKTPEIVWERSSKRVLVLEDVGAIKINDVDQLASVGMNANVVAAELARLTFEQIFNHGFFHADPHPGNIFVTPSGTGDASDFEITFIDFGMMGEISDERRRGLQSFIFALVARDARSCVVAMQKLGVLLPTIDNLELERAIAAMFERFGGIGVAELTQTDPRELRELALKFSNLIRTLPFQLPEDFLLLLRAISLISGVTSALNRDFNMWDAVDPFAKSLLNGGANGTSRALGREALKLATTVVALPDRLTSVLNRIDQGLVSVRSPEIENELRKLRSSTGRIISAIAFVGLLIAGTNLRIVQDPLGDWLLIGSLIPIVHATGIFRIR